jgi:anti-sigma regulatory factor (Ser/Thr protein kinase)
MTHPQPVIDHHTFRAGVSAPSQARQRINAACSRLSTDHRDAAALLVSELVTNAVRHPRVTSAAHRPDIVLLILRTHNMVRVEVIDHDPRPLPHVTRPASPSESGRGLQLVAALAAAWGSYPLRSQQGKVVWFELGGPAAS